MKAVIRYNDCIKVDAQEGHLAMNRYGSAVHVEITTEAAKALARGLAAQLGWKINENVGIERFVSRRLPKGYDTILGYLKRNFPDRVETLGEEATVSSTLRDGYWCMHECRRRGLQPIKVTAPLAAKVDGIKKVNAYPVEVLQARFG